MSVYDSDAQKYNIDNLVRDIHEIVLRQKYTSKVLKSNYWSYEVEQKPFAALHRFHDYLDVALALDEQPPNGLLVNAAHLRWKTFPVAARIHTTKDLPELSRLVEEACERVRAGKHTVNLDNVFFQKARSAPGLGFATRWRSYPTEIATHGALERLSYLHSCYPVFGRDYLPQSIGLDLAKWSGEYRQGKITANPKYGGFLAGLPNKEKVSRADVFKAFDLVREESSDVDKYKAVGEAFVAAMAWYRPTDSGASVTHNMLYDMDSKNSRPCVLNILLEAIHELRYNQSEPISVLGKIRGRVRSLSAQMETMLLYFASSVDNRAPIYDEVIVNWLRKYEILQSKTELVIGSKDLMQNYETYVDLCDEACGYLQVKDRGHIEYLIFKDGNGADFQNGNQNETAIRLGWPVEPQNRNR